MEIGDRATAAATGRPGGMSERTTQIVVAVGLVVLAVLMMIER